MTSTLYEELGHILTTMADPRLPSDYARLDSIKAQVMAMRDRTTTLEGATDMPDEGRRVANAGQFAAAWNDRTPEQREDLVVQLLHAQDVSMRCFQADHDRAVELLEENRKRWLVLYWHDECPECEAHAESAITYAQVMGSVGGAHQETEVITVDNLADPEFKPAIAHGARVLRAA